MKKLLAILLMVGFSALVFADDLRAQTPKVEVAGGYAYLHETDLSIPAGWFASVGGNVNDWFGIVGAVSGHYKTETVSGVSADAGLHTFVAGPKFASYRNPAVTPYAQVLFGGARMKASVAVSTAPGRPAVSVTVSENGFDVQPGAGVDINASKAFGIRVGVNVDVIRSGGETSKEFQFIAGVVFRK